MSELISIPGLRQLAEHRGPYLAQVEGDVLAALVEAVEGAQRLIGPGTIYAVRGPASNRLRDLHHALARFDFGDDS